MKFKWFQNNYQSKTMDRRQFVGLLASTATSLPVLASASLHKSENQLCVFSKHLQWLSIPEMAKTAAQLGFQGVDLTVRKGGHVAPDRVVEDLPKAVETIRKAGLEVAMLATDVIDPEHPLTEPTLKTASNLGIKYYRTAYLDFDFKIGVAKSIENHRVQLRKLAALNKKYNIHGAYQNHSGNRLGSSVWDLWEVLKDLDPDWMGCQYDVKHAVAEGGMCWGNGLNLLKSHIRCMDMKDFYWAKKDGKWQHQLVPLGEGMVDYKTYFSLLKQYNITGPMSIHYEFPLGGADVGKNQITIPKDVVLDAIKKDLETLKQMLMTY